MIRLSAPNFANASEATQGGADWHRQRLGKVTASRLADLTARTKTGWSASRASYMGQLLVERLTGAPSSIPTTPAMRWGLETEALAKAAYGFHLDREVVPSGFINHPGISMSGASPDGFIGDEGLTEIKCPTTITHIETVAAGEIPSKHRSQMLWQMACTGRSWCDFVSFDPRLPEPLKLFVRRVERSDAIISELEEQVLAFLDELDSRMTALIDAQPYEAAA